VTVQEEMAVEQRALRAVLGAAEVFPLDMAAAFGTLANEGVHCQPFVIAEVIDRHGGTVDVTGDGGAVFTVRLPYREGAS
jgi:membrane carboxypeptidase/penicillin-binding protein